MPDYSHPNPPTPRDAATPPPDGVESPESPEPPQSPSATAYLALGSNLGDRAAHLNAALTAIADLPGVADVQPSAFYETAPVGPQDQGHFLNAAARVVTTLPPEDLLRELLALENQLGRPPRDEREPWGPREIDLDLLLYGDEVIDRPGIAVPHPRMHERGFVLRPLCGLAPDVMHPTRQQTVRELLDALQPPAPAAQPTGETR